MSIWLGGRATKLPKTVNITKIFSLSWEWRELKGPNLEWTKFHFLHVEDIRFLKFCKNVYHPFNHIIFVKSRPCGVNRSSFVLLFEQETKLLRTVLLDFGRRFPQEISGDQSTRIISMCIQHIIFSVFVSDWVEFSCVDFRLIWNSEPRLGRSSQRIERICWIPQSQNKEWQHALI